MIETFELHKDDDFWCYCEYCDMKVVPVILRMFAKSIYIVMVVVVELDISLYLGHKRPVMTPLRPFQTR